MIAALLLLLAYAMGALLLFGARVKPLSYVPLIALPFGLLVCAVTVLAAWAIGVRPETSVPLIAVVVTSLFCADLWRGQRPPASPADALPRFFWSSFASLVIVSVYVFPIVLGFVWMGSGDAPPFFFDVDSPYYLSQVHALVRADTFPPPSLNAQGVALVYHYGGQMAAALFTRLGALPAHKALFWIVGPLLLAGKIAVVWRLASLAAARGLPHWLGVACLLFFVEYPVAELDESVIGDVLSQTGKALENTVIIFSQMQRFDTGFPMLGTLAGSFLVYLVALLMVDTTITRRLLDLALAVGTLPMIKSPYLMPVGIWVSTWAVYELITKRRLGPMIASTAALLLSVALTPLSVREGFALGISLNPYAQGEAWRYDISKGVAAYGVGSIVAAAIMLLAFPFRRGAQAAKGFDLAVVFLAASVAIMCLPVFVTVTDTQIPGRSIATSETLQWLTPATWITSVAVVLGLAASWRETSFPRRLATAGMLGLYLSVPVWAKLHESVLLVSDKRSGHDFADNRAIIPALAVIPTRGTLVVSNDLNYPADNYARDRRQFQIAALFGHQTYGAAVMYDRPADADRRVEEQEMLRLPAWTQELTSIACAHGWTHVLLSKRVPYVSGVPGTLVYDSQHFAVYALPTCSAP